MIRSFVTAIVVLFCVQSAVAQQLVGASTTSIPMLGAFHAAASQAHAPTSPLSTTDIHYFDPALPTFDWIGGANYGGIVSLMLGERITLPTTDIGYVDSVSVVIDSLQSDSVAVLLMPDTLFETSGGAYHLIDIFSGNSEYAAVQLYRQQLNLGGETVVHFDHVQVPKEFFVVVVTDVQLNAGVVYATWVRGDLEATRTRTAENTRSAMVGLYNGQFYSLVLDSAFTPPGQTQVAFSNLYARAFVSNEDRGVSTGSSSASAITISPNPATSTITVSNIEGTGNTSTIEVYDLLGRTVLSKVVMGNTAKLDVREIPNGTYRMVVRNGDAVHSTTLVVAH